MDIGNSRVKAGLFEKDKLEKEWTLTDLDALMKLSSTIPFDSALISSVKWTQEELEETLNFPFIWFHRGLALPITNAYKSPATLGLDRIAAAVGLAFFNPGGESLGIDLGTCITFEFLDGEMMYRGGGISPGINMRFRAMHGFTARLPLVGMPNKPPRIVGATTEECLQSGVYFGVMGEIEYLIARYRKDYPGLKVYICGGDAVHFESLTKDYIFVIPNLVLYGLNRILTYNVSIP